MVCEINDITVLSLAWLIIAKCSVCECVCGLYCVSSFRHWKFRLASFDREESIISPNKHFLTIDTFHYSLEPLILSYYNYSCWTPPSQMHVQSRTCRYWRVGIYDTVLEVFMTINTLSYTLVIAELTHLSRSIACQPSLIFICTILKGPPLS